jgi:hypothetical protein
MAPFVYMNEIIKFSHFLVFRLGPRRKLKLATDRWKEDTGWVFYNSVYLCNSGLIVAIEVSKLQSILQSATLCIFDDFRSQQKI